MYLRKDRHMIETGTQRGQDEKEIFTGQKSLVVVVQIIVSIHVLSSGWWWWSYSDSTWITIYVFKKESKKTIKETKNLCCGEREEHLQGFWRQGSWTMQYACQVSKPMIGICQVLTQVLFFKVEYCMEQVHSYQLNSTSIEVLDIHMSNWTYICPTGHTYVQLGQTYVQLGFGVNKTAKNSELLVAFRMFFGFSVVKRL